MNLVDSSGWIGYFINGPNAGAFEDAIKDSNQLVVSTINIYEVVRQMSLRLGETELLQNLTVMRRGQMAALNEEIALDAVKLSMSHKLPMADSMILATAYAYQATLWTQDIHFSGIADVKYIPKP